MAFIKTVNDKLVELMGSSGAKDLEQGFPQIILMAGLQVGACGYWLECSAFKQWRKLLSLVSFCD